MAAAYPNRTSPVLRGAFILKHIQGVPPANAAARRPDAGRQGHRHHQGADRARDDGEASRQPDVLVVPRGDGSARLRARKLRRDRNVARPRPLCRRRRSIPPASCPTARTINGPDDLRKALLRRPEQFVQTFTEGLLTYAMGRKLGVLRHADRPPDRRAARPPRDYKFSAIVQAVVESEQFRMRRVPQPAADAGERTIAGGRLSEGRLRRRHMYHIQEAHFTPYGAEGSRSRPSRCRCSTR